MHTGQNLIEKIVQSFCKEGSKCKVYQGDYVTLHPKYVMTHDNTAAVMQKFPAFQSHIKNPSQIVFTLDHNVQDRSDKNLAKYQKIQEFAQQHKINFYPAGEGIGHQIMCEEGYIWPGTLVVASDSHSNMYGGLGCLGTPVVRTDAAAIWAGGETWWQIPSVTKVILSGKLRKGVKGKDVIVTLCGLFANDEVLNHALEFAGDGIQHLTIDDRLTIANMTTEWGALVGLFPCDNVTKNWFQQRLAKIQQNNSRHPRWQEDNLQKLQPIVPDSDAQYKQVLHLDLSSVTPHVSGPNHVKTMNSVVELEKKNISIQKAYLVSCVNSRVQDLAEAAEIVAGKKIAPGVEFYIAAASKEVQKISEERGDWQKLLAAGAIPLPSGCGPCIGMGKGLLQDGEVGISATNRNFKGRMGSRNAEAYLASPAVVAASAIQGKIASPFKFENILPKGIRETLAANIQIGKTNLLVNFPKSITGRLLVCPEDNLNTDGIYPGKYTYQELPLEEQAKVVMENYDPNFSQVALPGDILLAGYNFGTGSSREQAATAFKAFGISCILAASFSQTYKRNALNNGFLVLEAPELYEEVKQQFQGILTSATVSNITVNFEEKYIAWDEKKYSILRLGEVAQQLIVTGGIQQWFQQKLIAAD